MPLSRPAFPRAFFWVAVLALVAAGGLCAAPSQAAERQSAGGWVYMASGVKAVFPGIHGGTAPVSLVPLADGRLQARSGETGQDFIHLMKKKEGGSAGGAAQTALPPFQSAAVETAREVVLANGQTVMLVPSAPMGAGIWPIEQEPRFSASREASRIAPARKRAFAPLKLRPYPVLTNLGQGGV